MFSLFDFSDYNRTRSFPFPLPTPSYSLSPRMNRFLGTIMIGLLADESVTPGVHRSPELFGKQVVAALFTAAYVPSAFSVFSVFSVRII